MDPSKSEPTSKVADHYDELDWVYRDLWGEHLHHGLWRSGSESIEEAVHNLVIEVATAARLRPGMRVGDIGCGYGAAGRELADQFGVTVDGYTISSRQHAYAESRLTPDLAGRVRLHLKDWLKVREETASYDALIAIECISHVEDAKGFLENAYRVLQIGGRLVMIPWLRSETASPRTTRWLLDPICAEGRLAALRSAQEYLQLAEQVGFTIESQTDLTDQVAPTWSKVIGRLLTRLLRYSEYRRLMIRGPATSRDFARAIFRIWLAYRIGAMRYGCFVLRKPKP